MTGKTDEQPFDILKEVYGVLRVEIGRSVAKQHQILLGGYTMVTLMLGYAFGRDAVSHDAAIAIPLLVLTMSSLWLVEANRLVRASNFIAFKIWPKLELLAELPSDLNWEIYCYQKVTKLQQRSCVNQHLGQMMVTVVMPLVVSFFCMLQVFNHAGSRIVPALGTKVFWTACSIWLVVFLFMAYRINQVSNLASNDERNPEQAHAPEPAARPISHGESSPPDR